MEFDKRTKEERRKKKLELRSEFIKRSREGEINCPLLKNRNDCSGCKYLRICTDRFFEEYERDH